MFKYPLLSFAVKFTLLVTTSETLTPETSILYAKNVFFTKDTTQKVLHSFP